MKKVLVLLSLIVFVAAVTAVFATDPQRDTQSQPKINCCHPDGKCEKVGKEDCAIKKGKEVSDCKECPGVWGEGKTK
jgi:hypothetical protein